MEKYKFTSVVAQDLLDSFLSFFPELKEQSVDCRAGEACRPPHIRASRSGSCGCDGWGSYCTRRHLCSEKAPWVHPSFLLPAVAG